MRFRNRGSSMFRSKQVCSTGWDDIFSTQLIDTLIEDVRNKKKTMVSTMDSVMMLMREVECEEKAAEKAKEEADQCSLGILAKVDELKQAHKRANETNDMVAREAYVQKDLLATKSDELQLQTERLLDNGERSLDLLNEMHRSLEKRLSSALMEKEFANKKKHENEASAREALSYEEIQMGKVEEESKRLKQEAVDISKLQEFLIDRGHVIDMLRGEIYDKCQDVKLLKDELDQVILSGGITSSSQTFSILATSSSSLRSSLESCHTDSDVIIKKSSGFGLGDSTDDKVQSANHKQIKSVESRPHVFKADIKNPNGVTDITGSIKKVKVKGKLRGNRMFAKSIKKVMIKGKLYGNGSQLFAKSVKKTKIKKNVYGSRMCAKRIKKMKIKGKLHGSGMFAKRIKKGEPKGKLHETRMFAKSIKKVKIEGLRVVSKISAAPDHSR